MDNTSSTGKDKKPVLPNQAALNIQADDSDDEAAQAESQPVVEAAAPEPKNPLQIAEIANLVAKHVPDESFEPNKAINAPINAQSALAATSTLFYAATQGPRIALKCALLASWGEEEKIKQLFNISPAHIGYMIAKADIEDPTGRKMRCSAIQYALWAQDWHMWDMMLTALDEAEARAIPKAQWDAIPDEAKQSKPYVDSITKEEIIAIRAALFKQYKEVVDTGLDYTRTRYDRVQDAAGKYQLINPRTVQVRGETHCDLKGPEFCLMRKDEQFRLEKNKLYVRIEGDTLHYQVIALSGEKVNGSIALADIQCPFVQLDNPGQLKPYIHKILKITSERDHTHPQALISAFDTYVYGLNNNWNDAQLEQQWCGGVGMAERFEATAVVAQEMCRKDVLLLDVDRGEFKEPRFPRTLKFFNYLSTNADQYDSWFSSLGHTRLGLDFGIVKWGYHAGVATWWRPADDDPVMRGEISAALSALCAERTIGIAELRDKLDPAKLRDVAVDQGPRLE
jgi:hypothetical protein